jgi:serine phosphatase RsbU (regulator of sigma subunit)
MPRFSSDRSPSELEHLREMRRALVPAGLPERPALDMASCFLPADENVGGDFFVVGEGPDGSSIVVIGDVVGRGVDAALRASYIRTLLIGFIRSCEDPARILTLTNDAVMSDQGVSADFVTAVCVVHRPEEREIAWALAGHPPPLRLDDGLPLLALEVGPPIGIDPGFAAETMTAPCAPGDGVLIYTDGVVEARRNGDLFGERRLSEVLAECAGLPPGDILDRVRDAIQDFSGGQSDDDVCMLALRARETPVAGTSEEVCSPHLVAP